jgi:SprT protein
LTNYTTRQEAYELINKTFIKCGQPDLVGKVSIQFNARFTSRMGDAVYWKRNDRGRVRLSSPLWHYASADERRNTIIHEACHILAERENQKNYIIGRGRRPKRVGHGLAWREFMGRAGIEKVERCHNVQSPHSAKRRKQRTYEASCGCQTWNLTANRVGRMKNGRWYSCKGCGETLVLSEHGE